MKFINSLDESGGEKTDERHFGTNSHEMWLSYTA